MNKHELVTSIRSPEKLSETQLKQLENIIADHPYFLVARLLLAKSSKELKLPETKKRIESAAIYSTDRLLLKKYISGNLLFLHDLPDSVIKAAEEETVVEAAHYDMEASSKPIEEGEVVIKKVKTRPSPDIPEVPNGLDSLLDELKQDMDNLKESRTRFYEIQQKIEEEDAVSAALERVSKVVTTDSKDKIPKKSTTKRKSNTKKKIASNKSDKPSKTEKKNDDGDGEREKKNKIINKFLKENPSLSKKASDKSTEQSDLSDDSASWHNDLASEYLAEIYLNQGNTRRAKEIYEILSLKFPEKKSYFADLISKIE